MPTAVRGARLLALTLATQILVIALVCGAQDETPPQARFALRGRCADARQLSWRVDGSGGPVDEKLLRQALERATAAWTLHGSVGFRECAADEPADFTVAWRPSPHAGCPPFTADGALAHTGPMGPGTFVHLDGDRSWNESTLRLTVLHELGHVLGLDHSPDEAALMSGAPDPGLATPTFSDLAALRTLYGTGPAVPGDLAIYSQGEARIVLRGVAPPQRTDWTLFDVEGDGIDELLLWRTDPEGAGDLWTFRFGPGPALVPNTGPRPGIVVPAATVVPYVDGDGGRWLAVAHEDGRRLAWRFDEAGRLQPATAEELGTLPDRFYFDRRVVGDLDGDGVPESIRPGKTKAH